MGDILLFPHGRGTSKPDGHGMSTPARQGLANARRWRINRIRGSRALALGVVEAPTAAAAIRQAIRTFAVTDPEQQRRLAAMPDDRPATG
jgi:hypothetical protein